MQALNQYLASALKQARRTRGWSLDTTAANTGVSKAMLGQIERGESSPTLATLWKIASGFDLSFTYFLGPANPEADALEWRPAEQQRPQLAEGEMQVSVRFPYDPKYGFEWFELALPPGYERISEPHNSGVVEHISVRSGEMEVFAQGRWHKLKAGDSLRFAADAEHGYRNLTAQTVQCEDLIYYPGP